jgi:hypothetical protein
MSIPLEVQNLIKYQARRFRAKFPEELRMRYTFADLEQEGYVVYQLCLGNFGKYPMQRARKQGPLSFYRNWFLGYLSGSLTQTYLRILRDHFAQRRDAHIKMLPMEDLNPDRYFYDDDNRLRVELRTDLELVKKRVSKKGVELINLILRVGEGEKIICNGDITRRVVEKKLKLSRYKTIQIIEEVRQALGR